MASTVNSKRKTNVTGLGDRAAWRTEIGWPVFQTSLG